MFKDEESLGEKYKINENGYAFYIAGDKNAIGYKPIDTKARIRDRILTSNFKLKGILGEASFYRTAKIASYGDFKPDGENLKKKIYK